MYISEDIGAIEHQISVKEDQESIISISNDYTDDYDKVRTFIKSKLNINDYKVIVSSDNAV
jgi:hypothetical protein